MSSVCSVCLWTGDLPNKLGSSQMCTRCATSKVSNGLLCWQHVDGDRSWQSRKESQVELKVVRVCDATPGLRRRVAAARPIADAPLPGALLTTRPAAGPSLVHGAP